MVTRLPRPEAIGTLTPHEAELFTAEFRHDWEAIRERDLLVGVEGIYLFGSGSGIEEIDLPVSYVQFLPAIGIAVAHERTVRGNHQLLRAVLTVRQSEVRAGYSQQGTLPNRVHRDAKTPGYLYSVSSARSTQYYPHIESTVDTPDALDLSDEAAADFTEFRPFDIVWASTMTYHRSPPLDERQRRTFLRLAFTYDLTDDVG